MMRAQTAKLLLLSYYVEVNVVTRFIEEREREKKRRRLHLELLWKYDIFPSYSN